MKRQLIFLVIVVIALIEVNCATTKPYDPFKIDQNKFYANTKTIVLAPCWIKADLEVPEEVIENFELILGDKLREAGFSVVASKEFTDIRSRMIEQMGGYFDPKTGKRDESKLKAVNKHCYRELERRFNSDAVLFSSIIMVEASFLEYKASWDGTEESLDMRSGTVKVLDFLLNTSITSGTVPALSLGVLIKDMHGTIAYANRGGIEVLYKRSPSFVPVPKSELFANEERNMTAVDIALEPLIQKSEFSE